MNNGKFLHFVMRDVEKAHSKKKDPSECEIVNVGREIKGVGFKTVPWYSFVPSALPSPSLFFDNFGDEDCYSCEFPWRS